jgi:uncharacterized protein (TIGR04540 family)
MGNHYPKHPRTIEELALELKKVVDDHRNHIISDETLEDVIHYWSANEGDKLFDDEGNNIRSTIQFRIGKRRVALIKKILDGFPRRII